MPTVLHGSISDYNEQGMESDFYLTFQDAAFMGPDGQWDREGWFILAPGDRLTIFHDDGSVLWEGEFGAKPHTLAGRIERWIHKYRMGWHPEDVPYETWIGWFRTRPHLRATLVRPPS